MRTIDKEEFGFVWYVDNGRWMAGPYAKQPKNYGGGKAIKYKLVPENIDTPINCNSAIPMAQEFMNRLDKVRKDVEENDLIKFDSDQAMEEFVIKQMTGEYLLSYHSDIEKIEFIKNIYKIGRTVGASLKLNYEISK